MQHLNEILEKYGIKNGTVKENEYSYTVMCDKSGLKGNSILSIPTEFKLPDSQGKVQQQYLYYLPKKNVIDFKQAYSKEHLEHLKKNGTKIIIGFDLLTGEPVYANMKELTNMGVVGSQGSGKSVVLFNVFYQLYHKDFVEFIIVDKGDLSLLSTLPKVISAINIENSDVMESFFPFYNYLCSENVRRKNLFAKYNKITKNGISNYYEYMDAIFSGEIDSEPLNQIFCILDEFNTWRERISNSLNDKESKVFDDAIAVIINTMRSVGINLIPSAQTFYAGDLGTVRKGGVKKWVVGNAKNVDELLGDGGREHKVNLLNNIQGSFCFFDSETQKYMKIPFISSSKMLVNELETFGTDTKYVSNKTGSIVETLNRSILADKESSVVFSTLDDTLAYFGIKSDIEGFSKKLGYRFLGYSILLWKMKFLIETDAISNSIKLLGDFTFPKPNGSTDKGIDELIYSNIQIFQNENKMVQDLEKLLVEYDISRDEDEREEIVSRIGTTIVKNVKQKGLSV